MLSDLTEAEIEELDRLLSQTPEPLTPLDVFMVDGFLCGVLVQPVLVDAARWLPRCFDMDGAPLPDDADPAWRARCEALLLRRHAALQRAIAEDGWFDPIVNEPPGEGDAEEFEALSQLPPYSRGLAPWVGGFHEAQTLVPALTELDDDAVSFALARIYRHLPPEDGEQLRSIATLDREMPLANYDDAIDDVVAAVVDLSELTEPLRFHVETVRRDAPKVGRNEPCPCGSGRKFKHCHGAS